MSTTVSMLCLESKVVKASMLRPLEPMVKIVVDDVLMVRHFSRGVVLGGNLNLVTGFDRPAPLCANSKEEPCLRAVVAAGTIRAIHGAHPSLTGAIGQSADVGSSFAPLALIPALRALLFSRAIRMARLRLELLRVPQRIERRASVPVSCSRKPPFALWPLDICLGMRQSLVVGVAGWHPLWYIKCGSYI